MSKQVQVIAAAATLLMTATIGAPTAAAFASAQSVDRVEAAHHTAARTAVKRGAALAVSAKQVEEGDRLTLTVTIKSARQASKVALQKWHPSLYGWDTPTWDPVTTKRVLGKAKVKFAAVATSENTERYRVKVAY